jgi:hypothetical protein
LQRVAPAARRDADPARGVSRGLRSVVPIRRTLDVPRLDAFGRAVGFTRRASNASRARAARSSLGTSIAIRGWGSVYRASGNARFRSSSRLGWNWIRNRSARCAS